MFKAINKPESIRKGQEPQKITWNFWKRKNTKLIKL